LVTHVIGGGAAECLRTVAALEKKRFATSDRRQAVLQLVALPREDQWRHRSELAEDRMQGCRVRPLGLLCRGQGTPPVEITHFHPSQATGRRDSPDPRAPKHI